MDVDVSQVLGQPVLAGAFVSPRGATRKITAGTAGAVVGGLVGTAVSAAMEKRSRGGGGALPEFGRFGYLAVTATDVALLRAKSAVFKPKVVSEVVARVPRTAISDIRFESGLLSRLSIQHADGSLWEFEIPWAWKNGVVTAVRTLTLTGAPAGAVGTVR